MDNIKYLDMENASLDISFKTMKEYEIFFDEQFTDLVHLNFKRIYVNVSSEYLNNMVKLLKKYDLPFIIKTYLNDVLKLSLPENIILINTNPNLKINLKNVYNQVLINESNFNQIIDLLEEDYFLVLEPEIDIKKIYKINNLLDKLFAQAKNKLLNIGNYMVPTTLIKEHPCNCYLCNGWKCHKKISGLPKVLYVDSHYNIYPHYIKNSNMKIGNIKQGKISDVLINYLHSNEYLFFVKCCKKVFIEFLPNYPFQFFPVSEYIKVVANEI